MKSGTSAPADVLWKFKFAIKYRNIQIGLNMLEKEAPKVDTTPMKDITDEVQMI